MRHLNLRSRDSNTMHNGIRFASTEAELDAAVKVAH
jgi:hypothetical protein